MLPANAVISAISLAMLMKSKQLRDVTFVLHRYLGLAIGLMLIFVGLTGSLLVFQDELNDLLIAQQFGQVIPHIPG